ncbi:C-type lectin domain family 7 member A-like [Dendropsophus ebraccatus]|uniref:C-type lectin domain family 7 member A-like n=1 Tax=Dendropsophus ebraccatus TaxID=150705 RepID=UPI0038310B50
MGTPDSLKIWMPSWRGVIIAVSLGINIILIRCIMALVFMKRDCESCESPHSECDCSAIKELCLMRSNTSTECHLCPPNWLLHGDHCYYFSSAMSTSWNQSRDQCKMMGTDLLVIKDKEQQEFIQRSLSQRTDDLYWIGLHPDGDGWMENNITAA